MNHCFGIVGAKDRGQALCIVMVALFERPPFYEVPMPGRQIVINDGAIARLRQELAGVSPNISSAAGNKHLHHDTYTLTSPVAIILLLS